jgi:serine/threonine protein phosphatase PrpC
MPSPDSDTVDFVAPPASIQVVVDIGAATHPGCVRPNNEDSYLVVRASRSLETLHTSLPEGSIPLWSEERSFGFIVADGMGGHAAGEVASRLALRTVIEHVLATADWIMRDPDVYSDKIEERIAERFSAANEAVHEQAAQHPLLSGMGTTMTMAASLGTRLFLGHVGDSRAYLLRGGQLQVLTRDHSIVQTLADAGVISREQAATHRMRNVLLRSLGGNEAKADVRHLMLETGDQLLLCTDGLNEMVPEPTIGEILQSSPGAQAACDQLVSAALAAGGKDNVTVVLAKYGWLT